MENILDIDLNEVVSKSIKEKIAELEAQANELQTRIYQLQTENKSLKDGANMTAVASGLVAQIQQRWNLIKVAKTADCREISQIQGRYMLIRDLVEAIHNATMPKEMLGFRADFYAFVYNCKDRKELVIPLLEMIGEATALKLKDAIKAFRMPSEWSVQEIKSFLKKPHYGYNGGRFGGVGNWIENNFQSNYAPYDLIFQNPHIVSDECFELVIDAIKGGVQYSEDFFGIALHNHHVSDDQIKALGTLAATIPITKNNQDSQQVKFISKYVGRFHKADIDSLFERINLTTTDWKPLHYSIFPVEYQMRAFRKMSFKGLRDLIGGYNLRHSPEQVEAIFADWFIHNPHPHTPRKPK